MTENRTPSLGATGACPFVAFEEDRDVRADRPDHRHRCYAEVRPAPRALPHQEAYCLSSTFAVCPTFQDWARREAARATTESTGPVEEDAGAARATSGQPGRNPPRDWTAPPPWLADEGAAGLSGSMADRLATGGEVPAQEKPPVAPAGPSDRPVIVPRAVRLPDEGHAADPLAIPEPPRRQPRDAIAPSWERPRRMEAYPVIRSRFGLPSISVSPLLLGVAALFLAAVGLFLLPGFLGLGGPDAPGPTATPAASAGPSASAEPSSEPSGDASAGPSIEPGPTPTIYVVRSGDSLSEIAARFSVKLADLLAANPQIVDPNRINVGDEIVIPSAGPTAIPDAGTPSPGAS